MRVYLFGGAVAAVSVDVNDTITVSESVKAVVTPLAVHASESCTVTDGCRVGVSRAVRVADAITVTDTGTAFLSEDIVRNVNDTITVAEFCKPVLRQLAVHVSESCTATDVCSAALGYLSTNRAETLTVSESRTALLVSIRLTVNKAESIHVGEGRTIVGPLPTEEQTEVAPGRSVRFEFTHPRLGNYAIDLPAYKWGYVTGTEWLHRALNTTAYGVHRRIPLSITRRATKVRFVETDDLIDQMRVFTSLVHRFGADVRFYPDYIDDPETYWTLDWALDVGFSRVLDNRQQLELTIVEHSPGGVGA
jgi:hypothetical protein